MLKKETSQAIFPYTVQVATVALSSSKLPEEGKARWPSG